VQLSAYLLIDAVFSSDWESSSKHVSSPCNAADIDDYPGKGVDKLLNPLLVFRRRLSDMPIL
jgi:hypothetical protein